jgi:hypothetical protein
VRGVKTILALLVIFIVNHEEVQISKFTACIGVHNDNNYEIDSNDTVPVRTLGVHLDHLKLVNTHCQGFRIFALIPPVDVCFKQPM